MSLSPTQLAAVERTNQDVCVVAGPGSGKTRVLTERFRWLVEYHGVQPGKILAITFTEKAATEIKERLIKRFEHSPEHREAIERAWVSTIDGFCARLLQENAIAAGIAPDFAVLEQPQAERLARESSEEALEELYQEQPDAMRRLLEALDLSTNDLGRKPDLAECLLDIYESQRLTSSDEEREPRAAGTADVWPEARRLTQEILMDRGKPGAKTPELLEWCASFLALPESSVTAEHFAASNLKTHLTQIGKTRSASTKQLRDEILPALRAQWMEALNAGLLDLLREAVTRLDRIYRQKKRDRSSLDFADLEQDAIRLLEENYKIRRDTQSRFDQILMDELQDTNRLQWRLLDLIRTPDAFFAVGDINQSIYGFRHADPDVFREYRDGLVRSGAAIDDLRENHRSRQSILDAVSNVLDGQPGIEYRPLIAAGSFPPIGGPSVERIYGESAEIEASLVADRILQLHDEEHYPYKEIAILLRNLGALKPFTEALDQFQIPFLTTGGRTFLESREIIDLLNFLAALVNPLDEIALIGVLRGPFVNLTDEEILRLGRQGWQELFESQFGHLRRQAGFISPDRLLPEQPDLSPRARANVDKLTGWLRREHRARPRPLAEILDDLEHLRSSQSEAEASPPEAGDVVQLMSIHAAKGLEFRAVFVSALHKGADRSTPVVAFSRTAGLGAKWRNPATKDSQPDSVYAAILEDRKQREAAEEDRLLYVAMTRAEQRLYLTYTKGKQARTWQKLVEAAVPAEFTSGQVIPGPLRSKSATSIDVQFVDPPILQGQQDSTLSVTSLQMFAICPRRYFLSRYLGLDSGAPALLGSEVHEILSGGIGTSPEALELAARFPESELGRRAARSDRVEHDYDFLLAIEDVVLRGEIDLWFEEGGELIVVDYKTDRHEHPENYAIQLRLYALALERYLGRRPDRAVLFYLRSGTTVDVLGAPGDLDQVKDIVKELIEDQKTMSFPLNEGEHCYRCTFYKGLCPAGKT